MHVEGLRESDEQVQLELLSLNVDLIRVGYVFPGETNAQGMEDCSVDFEESVNVAHMWTLSEGNDFLLIAVDLVWIWHAD